MDEIQVAIQTLPIKVPARLDIIALLSENT